MPSWVAVLTVYLPYLVTVVTPVNPGCDCVVYQSYGLNDGHFTSPNFPALYPPNTNCILYSFFGDSFEIIELTFLELDLRMPDANGTCTDFIRIFQNLERPEVNENSQWDVELCGNYSSLPRKTFYSSDRSLILEFHSQSPHNNKYRGFSGIYQFLDKKTAVRNYFNTGRRVDGHPCMYEFYSNSSEKSKTGQFFSPFYPQTYKGNSLCRYKLLALPGERVKVVFSNIQLHHNDGSCYNAPDVVTVYDGEDTNSNVIAKYCGFHNNEETISLNSQMLVVFKSDQVLHEQGFAASYEFIVPTNPGFFKNNTKEPVPPSSSSVACGEIINSLERKNGTIESPNYPRAYPPKMTCRFTFKGVGRERIQLRFVHMDLHFPSGDPADPMDCTESDSVTVYITINGQAEALDTYCGEKLPPMLMSNNHAMTVEFRSFHSSLAVTGFRANFEFVTNFGITTGKQDSRGTCIFNYMSHKEPDGHIMSPNYPGLYPRNTECHYLFYGRPKERVHITFLFFEVDGIPPRCEEHTNSDYVSFSNFAETEDRKLYRLCGQSSISKHKVESDGAFFRVTFMSNHLYDAHGFQAFYQFYGGAEPTGKLSPESVANPDRNGDSNGSNGAVPSQTLSAGVCLLWLLCLLTLPLLTLLPLDPQNTS